MDAIIREKDENFFYDGLFTFSEHQKWSLTSTYVF